MRLSGVKKYCIRTLPVFMLAAVTVCCGGSESRVKKAAMPLPGVTQPPPSAPRKASRDGRGLGRLEDRVRQAIIQTMDKGRTAVRPDRGIDAACRSTSDALLASGDLGAVASHLRLELQAEQITDVSYLPFTFELSVFEAPPRDVIDFMRAEAFERGISHIGVGAASLRNNRALVTVVLLRRLNILSAFPRSVASDSSHLLWIRPTSRMVRNPRAILATPGGDIEDLGVLKTSRGLEVPLTFDAGEGRYVLQVMAEDGYGVHVTNQADIWVGQPPMRIEKPPPGPEWGSDPVQQEEQMVDLINRFRRSHGLSELRNDPRLVASARRHSADMRDHQFFGHRSPRRGDLDSRLGGLKSRMVLENIAMSVSVTWAHDGLVSSPMHRRALLDPRVTHLGVGVSIRHAGSMRVVYVTQHLGRL